MMGKKRRKIWIGIAALTAVAVGYLALPKDPDGFEFLRKYKPLEYASEAPIADLAEERQGVPRLTCTGTWYKVFHFPKNSLGLEAELRRHTENPYLRGDLPVSLPNGRKGFYYATYRLLTIYDEPAPSWLDRQVLALRRRFAR